MTGNNTTALQVYKVSGLNAKATGATQIFTSEGGNQNFYIIAAFVESTAASSITLPVLISIGTNGASYNDILPITTATGLTAVSKYIPMPISLVSAVIAPSTSVFVNITTAATGTSQTLTAGVIGFYAP